MKDKIILENKEFDIVGWRVHDADFVRAKLNVMIDKMSKRDVSDYIVLPEIVDVKYNDPATIVFWSDHTKTVAKCSGGDTYNPEMGLMVCIAKKYFGKYDKFRENFEKWSTKAPEPKEEFYNGRVVCIHVPNSIYRFYTKGKIYDVVDGQLRLDTGAKHPFTPATTFTELQARCNCEFIEIKE